VQCFYGLRLREIFLLMGDAADKIRENIRTMESHRGAISGADRASHLLK